jgi:hypothetical protein
MPTHDDEFQPPSVPCASLGLLTVGTVHEPDAVTHLP